MEMLAESRARLIDLVGCRPIGGSDSSPASFDCEHDATIERHDERTAATWPSERVRHPLLERKRILESVLRESRLVRLGTYVRPPIDGWIGAWRMFGFRRLSFRGANSRYVPGAKNQEWAQAEIPRR